MIGKDISPRFTLRPFTYYYCSGCGHESKGSVLNKRAELHPAFRDYSCPSCHGIHEWREIDFGRKIIMGRIGDIYEDTGELVNPRG